VACFYGPDALSVTINGVKALKETQSTDHNPEKTSIHWLHRFFNQHWTPEGSSSDPTLQCLLPNPIPSNQHKATEDSIFCPMCNALYALFASTAKLQCLWQGIWQRDVISGRECTEKWS